MDTEELKYMYDILLLSIPDISKKTGISLSTVRNRLLKHGVKLRSRTEGIRLNPEKLGHPGIKREFSIDWKNNMSTSKSAYWNGKSKGFSLKPSGYYEITQGCQKGRLVHDVIAEEKIGRKLLPTEVAHHINEVKTDNRPENIQVMTRSEHSKHHACSRIHKRSEKGQFINI